MSLVKITGVPKIWANILKHCYMYLQCQALIEPVDDQLTLAEPDLQRRPTGHSS